jgi:hypothetical protein
MPAPLPDPNAVLLKPRTPTRPYGATSAAG